ncbi:MAG: EutN/CcmL family microcompartment protein [Caldicoprobacterales bacterium]|jgi:ethanolamine utilization protein EutN|nr:EutN/CcmL family microcompartment protein [Clostridiales bacterium]
MYAARVIGTVVCTTKDEKLSGRKMQVVQPVNLLNLEDEGKPAVAIDTVGAGESEIVLVVGGSSARQTHLTNNTPVDAVIMAIVDYIDIEGNKIYDKHKWKAGV